MAQGINASHVVVQTAAGGWTEGGYPGDFVSTELADHSLKPIITRVESYGHSINPRAICFESAKRHLYYSNIGKQSIERVIVTDDTAIVEYDTFLPKIGRVHGMAIDAKEGRCGGFLYFSDAQSGTISRIELNTEGRPSTAAIQVLVSAVNDPMGVALEPNGWRLFFTLSEGSIRAVARDGSDVSASRRTIHNEGGGYEVRRFDSGTRLDGLAISLSDEGGDDPTERRLYWTESGRSPALKRSSLDGTRVETISVMDSAGQNIRPVWPRGVAFGSGPSAGLFYYERLGGVRRLLDPAGGNSEVLLEEDPNPTALAIKALITRTEKRGGKGDSMVFFKSSS